MAVHRGAAILIMHEELVKFAQENYPEFAFVPLEVLHRWFETYKDTTIINRDANGEIKGFAIYQKWPSFLNFIIICGREGPDNLKQILAGARERFGDQTIAWFDEKRMEARFVQCRQ